MDTLTNRQQAIEATMRAYRAEFVQIGQDIEPMMALDHERGHYQFFWYGWQRDCMHQHIKAQAISLRHAS